MELQWLVNWGLLITAIGTGILVWASVWVNPVNAFREKEGKLEVSIELLRDLSARFIKLAQWGLILIGVGTLVQMISNF